MPRRIAGLLLATFAVGVILAAPAAGAADKAAVDKAFAELPKYDWSQSRAFLNPLNDAITASNGNQATQAELQDRLLAVLKTPGATRAAKQYCCRKLALIGTVKALPVLDPMLADQELSHMARYALERIPGEAVSKALRDAAGKLTGELKIGMINSLAARRDAGSVPMLVGLLKSSDAQVASAAASALGRIGDKSAATPLIVYVSAAPKADKGQAYDAALELATAVEAADKALATDMFSKLYTADNPTRVRAAALKGLAKLDPVAAAPKIAKALASDSFVFRGLAGSLIKTMPAEAANTFVAELPKLPSAGQIALINALADRRDTAAREAVIQAAGSSDKYVAEAAVAALGAVGNAKDVPLLAKIAASDSATSNDARAAFKLLRGEDVDAAIVTEIGKADPAGQVQLIGALADRDAKQTAGTVEKLTASDNADVRKAAITALGQLGNETHIPALVGIIKTPKPTPDAGAAGAALAAIATRVKAKAVAPITAGLADASPDAQASLYNALARAGGPEAMNTVVKATQAGNDGAVRALTSWSTPNAIAPLLTIAETSTNKVHKILSARAVIRLAALPDTPTAEALAAMSKVMKVAPSEQSQAIGALGDITSVESLKMLVPFLDNKATAEIAGAGIVKIARKLIGSNKAVCSDALKKVVAAVRSSRTKSQAQAIYDRANQ